MSKRASKECRKSRRRCRVRRGRQGIWCNRRGRRSRARRIRQTGSGVSISRSIGDRGMTKNKKDNTCLIPDPVELFHTNRVRGPGANPLVVEIMIVQAHDGLHTTPFRRIRVDAEPTVLGGGCHIAMNDAQTVGRREFVGGGGVTDRGEVRGGEAVKEVGISTVVV
jgi:hypothetical protein